MTEGCRGEGGILVTKMATVICKITASAELRWASRKTNTGTRPRGQTFSAFSARWRKGNTISTPRGDVALSRPASPRREKTA
ncbi:hypothetical protein ACNKHU_26890 [Shigella flexneri]